MTVDLRELDISGVFELVPRRFEDERGFFSETYNAETFAQAGLSISWAQDNHSLSTHAGVLRGLHYQLPPFAQDKLVRVARGRAYDVVLDIRRQSATFGQWVGLELSAHRWNQLFVPKGFAHGYLTLEPNTEVLYKVSNVYSPEHERSISFEDPAIAINWPVEGRTLVVSEKDANAGPLADADLPARWED